MEAAVYAVTVQQRLMGRAALAREPRSPGPFANLNTGFNERNIGPRGR